MRRRRMLEWREMGGTSGQTRGGCGSPSWAERRACLRRRGAFAAGERGPARAAPWCTARRPRPGCRGKRRAANDWVRQASSRSAARRSRRAQELGRAASFPSLLPRVRLHCVRRPIAIDKTAHPDHRLRRMPRSRDVRAPRVAPAVSFSGFRKTGRCRRSASITREVLTKGWTPGAERGQVRWRHGYGPSAGAALWSRWLVVGGATACRRTWWLPSRSSRLVGARADSPATSRCTRRTGCDRSGRPSGDRGIGALTVGLSVIAWCLRPDVASTATCDLARAGRSWRAFSHGSRSTRRPRLRSAARSTSSHVTLLVALLPPSIALSQRRVDRAARARIVLGTAGARRRGRRLARHRPPREENFGDGPPVGQDAAREVETRRPSSARLRFVAGERERRVSRHHDRFSAVGSPTLAAAMSARPPDRT